MSRIIKFRAWDGFRMYEPCVWMGKEYLVLPDSFIESHLMQFTGFRDFFEGDILEFDLEDGQKEIGVIRFSEAGFWTSQLEGMSEELLSDELDYYKEKCRCIGNIYQNPELL